MAAAPKTKTLLQQFRRTAEQAGAQPFPVEFLDDKVQRAKSATEGSTAIIQDPKIKEASKNLLDNSPALAGKKASPKTIEKAKKTLDNPQELAKVARKEQTGQKQSSMSDAFAAAAVHFTPIILGGLLGGEEGVAIGAQAGAKQADILREEESQDKQLNQQRDLQTERLEQQESQFSRKLEQTERLTKLRIASAASRGDKTAAARFVPGSGFAATKKDAETAKKNIAAADELGKLVSKMKQVRKDAGMFGFEFVDRELVSKGKSIASQAKLALKELAELGAISGPDQELLLEQIPEDPTEFGLGGIDAKLDQLLDNVKTSLKSKLNSLGLQTREERMKQLQQKRDGK